MRHMKNGKLGLEFETDRGREMKIKEGSGGEAKRPRGNKRNQQRTNRV